MRLIDADVMKERLGMGHECDECDDPRACRYDSIYAKRDFCLWIDDEPTVEERKSGKWHQRFYSQIEMMVCSECNSEFSHDAETGVRDYNYCPNCGAKMGEMKDAQNKTS